jgi:DNA repair protein RecN (Recombination protein N)
MHNGRIEVKREEMKEAGPNGYELFTFYFSANKGHELRELGKIASGGERSRVMLVIKSLVAASTALPTLIFDEIDSGISGETARKVGLLMKKLSEKHQVLTITHLPQIAGLGKRHFLVYKESSGKRTLTRIRALSEEERMQEIAKMLSGEDPSEAALENARELLAH